MTEGQAHESTQARALLEGKKPENVIADKAYDSNEIQGKTFQEIDQLLRAKGFTLKGPDPLHGKGSYFSSTTNRKYYLDYAGKTYKGGVTELPHVDVHYNIPVNGLEKQRFPIGEYLYELE